MDGSQRRQNGKRNDGCARAYPCVNMEPECLQCERRLHDGMLCALCVHHSSAIHTVARIIAYLRYLQERVDSIHSAVPPASFMSAHARNRKSKVHVDLEVKSVRARKL